MKWRLGVAWSVIAVAAVLGTGCGSSQTGATAGASGPQTADAAGQTAGGAAPEVPELTRNGNWETIDEFRKKVEAASFEPKKRYRIALLTECVDNPYCQAQVKAFQDAVATLGGEGQIFDAKFNPDTQYKQGQDAANQDFDGYVLKPVTMSVGCQIFKALQQTGKPVVIANGPICDDSGWHKGTVGYVAGHGVPEFYEIHALNAFASCTDKCKALVVGPPLGTDIFTRWDAAVKKAQGEYPQVDVVANQPGNFEQQSAFQVTQDALSANPDVSIILSAGDEMLNGIIAAVKSSGRTPGQDVRIYSIGGGELGLKALEQGALTETTLLLPYTETYSATLVLGRYLETGKDLPGLTWGPNNPKVADTTGSLFVTKDNMTDLEPEW